MAHSRTDRSSARAAADVVPFFASSAPVRLDTSLELLCEHLNTGYEAGVLATVVSTEGSTYRKAGARMLIMADGSCLGLLSGGCLEADLKMHAQHVLQNGVPRALEYDMRGPDDVLFGIGAGCEGAMRVLLEPISSGSVAEVALLTAGRATRAGLPTSLVTIHDAAELALGTYGVAPPLPGMLVAAAEQSIDAAAPREVTFETAGRRARAFVQFLAPRPHLLICGAGPDAQPIAAWAQSLRWRVTVVDHRPAYAMPDQFPGAEVRLIDPSLLRSMVDLESCHAAVVMSHHLLSDATYLGELAEAGAPQYVGLLGPAARRTRLVQKLGPKAAKLNSRLRGPVGIDIGAATPEGIALAILSEIHAWLAGPPAGT
jgi:xanthine/CO dehydrogenase XdhC/CoxF family maturation factor